MRALSPQFINRLSQNSLTLCRGWSIKRKDGFEINITDHDENINANGKIFVKSPSFDAYQSEAQISLSPDKNAISGSFCVGQITEDDIKLGKWDKAIVNCFIIDWQQSENFVNLWAAVVININQIGQSFEFELHGLESSFENPIGRKFSRFCDAILGDDFCKVNLNQIDNYYDAQITTAIHDNIKINSGNFTNYNDYIGGEILFNSGLLQGYKAIIKSINLEGSLLSIYCNQSLPINAQANDSIRIFKACDKSFATCKSRFNNQDNFRGCPYMIGEGAIIQGPEATNNDGSARQ